MDSATAAIGTALTPKEHASVTLHIAEQVMVLAAWSKPARRSTVIRMLEAATDRSPRPPRHIVESADICAMLLSWLADGEVRCYPRIDDILRRARAAMSSAGPDQRKDLEPMAMALLVVTAAMRRARSVTEVPA